MPLGCAKVRRQPGRMQVLGLFRRSDVQCCQRPSTLDALAALLASECIGRFRLTEPESEPEPEPELRMS